MKKTYNLPYLPKTSVQAQEFLASSSPTLAFLVWFRLLVQGQAAAAPVLWRCCCLPQSSVMAWTCEVSLVSLGREFIKLSSVTSHGIMFPGTRTPVATAASEAFSGRVAVSAAFAPPLGLWRSWHFAHPRWHPHTVWARSPNHFLHVQCGTCQSAF